MAEYPKDWRAVLLATVMRDPAYGVGAAAVPYDHKVKYIRITDIDDDSHRFCPAPVVSPAYYESKHLVVENDILIARTGASVGKSYLYDQADGKLAYAGFLMKFNVVGADAKFVFLQTLTKRYEDWVAAESLRTGQPGLNLSQLKTFEIVLPPLPEQKRIAKVLGDVDKLIENLGQRIEKKKLIKKGAMQELLTGEKRLPGFSGEWGQYSLKMIGRIFKGAGISRSESNSGSIPAVRYGEIYTHHNDFVKHYVSRISPEVAASSQITARGDVLFTGSGETLEDIGKAVAIVDDGVYAGGDTIVFSPYAETDPKFFGYLLNMPYIQAQKSMAGHGATIIHLRPEDIASILVNIPEVDEQNAIAKVLSDMDAEIDNLEKQQAKLKLVKKGMLQDLLTGKVRI